MAGTHRRQAAQQREVAGGGWRTVPRSRTVSAGCSVKLSGRPGGRGLSGGVEPSGPGDAPDIPPARSYDSCVCSHVFAPLGCLRAASPTGQGKRHSAPPGSSLLRLVSAMVVPAWCSGRRVRCVHGEGSGERSAVRLQRVCDVVTKAVWETSAPGSSVCRQLGAAGQSRDSACSASPPMWSRNRRGLELLPFALYPGPGSLCPLSSPRAWSQEGGRQPQPAWPRLASGTCQRTPGTSAALGLAAGRDGGCRGNQLRTPALTFPSLKK